MRFIKKTKLKMNDFGLLNVWSEKSHEETEKWKPRNWVLVREGKGQGGSSNRYDVVILNE